ncbi:hypothetical protein HanXRQr2_Chr03g0138031 [Helianthus annuus]|uniref:Uncharacterized protein n=1 Tax=Helianthus annuus TaxID=4232 RepID=A0A9K3JKB2_HELAN|nr:hypothetical protein HanXRQr2_Chr03g0138031 [Helianthus annuus]KAJ0946024.1 hypothetical protein HanPSC8_Chr03g0134611 [Helianthus annuus]
MISSNSETVTKQNEYMVIKQFKGAESSREGERTSHKDDDDNSAGGTMILQWSVSNSNLLFKKYIHGCKVVGRSLVV